jgi:hypothetical protein
MADDEYNRDERIETLYQGWGAREMAERIIDLEDELGEEKDGICTGMHADVAEARAEVERLKVQVESFRGWRASIYEVARCSFRSAGRSRKLADRYRLAWLSARRRAADEANMGMEALELTRQEVERQRFLFRHAQDRADNLALAGVESDHELRRLRAFAADVIAVRGWAFDGSSECPMRFLREIYGSTYELEAAEREGRPFKDRTARRVEEGYYDEDDVFDAEEVRQSTSGAPRLECVGSDGDGGTVWRLAEDA